MKFDFMGVFFTRVTNRILCLRYTGSCNETLGTCETCFFPLAK